MHYSSGFHGWHYVHGWHYGQFRVVYFLTRRPSYLRSMRQILFGLLLNDFVLNHLIGTVSRKIILLVIIIEVSLFDGSLNILSS